MKFRRPEGTSDILPDGIGLRRRLEEVVRECATRFGYEEVRTPAFEYTSLFHKSSGETTDIVEKEMYTFSGGGDDAKGTFSLRPELTPGVVRAAIEGNLFERKGFWKLWYLGPAFRKERPQKGRLRQFTQFGVEAIGSNDPLVDAETMMLFADILTRAGVKKWKLKVNTMGCGACRGGYRDALKKAIEPDLERYCGNCRRRFERNVFRILDCKVEADVKLSTGLPAAIDHVCGDCRDHLKTVEGALREAKVAYRINPRLVRGLDYYTRTVYEFTSPRLGAQDAMCGGGRYDTLVRDMGGPDVGSVGFAAGIERILMAMEGEPPAQAPDAYVVAVTPEERPAAFRALNALRATGISGDMDFEGRSLKAQMRSANKSKAAWVVMIGPDEAGRGKVKLKDMNTGTEDELSPDEAVVRISGGKR